VHVHILGIGGTFMGGIAAIAKAAGFRVTGADRNVYPPMSTQLEALGIRLIEGYGAEQLDPKPDVVIVGNALSRGVPAVEAMLDRNIRYVSGPQWLAEQVLTGRHVLAVAGTHGKTTTSSMLAWILEHEGLAPGFLIGGVPANFDATARLGDAPYFVIEADEYDTAFFDKRAKFVHYHPRTVILNNLEFDHADIYPDIAAIRVQFNQLLRTVPASGRIIVNAGDENLAAALRLGCWTPCETFGASQGTPRASQGMPGAAAQPRWSAHAEPQSAGRRFDILCEGRAVGSVDWPLIGEHNVSNALAAVAAASHVGITPERGSRALSGFRGVKRRMEIRGNIGGVTVYDDFAHHPTAIDTTLRGLRAQVGSARIVTVFEPRSNTMKLGVHRDTLAGAFAAADRSWFYCPDNLGWDLRAGVASLGGKARFAASVGELVAALAAESAPGDHILVMSNGGFGGLHEKLLAALRASATS
jgi:UDP-N-acetylmuramate: L-alanyl-gamma-D-glutamyl-meso-diaminopimelate ligase